MWVLECLCPREKVRNDLPYANQLRSGIIPIALLHVILGVIGIIFISFKILIANIFYCIFLWNVYQALSSWALYFYMFFVVANVFFGMFSIWFMDAPQFFIFLGILIAYFLAINRVYYVSRAFLNSGENDGSYVPSTAASGHSYSSFDIERMKQA